MSVALSDRFLSYGPPCDCPFWESSVLRLIEVVMYYPPPRAGSSTRLFTLGHGLVFVLTSFPVFDRHCGKCLFPKALREGSDFLKFKPMFSPKASPQASGAGVGSSFEFAPHCIPSGAGPHPLPDLSLAFSVPSRPPSLGLSRACSSTLQKKWRWLIFWFLRPPKAPHFNPPEQRWWWSRRPTENIYGVCWSGITPKKCRWWSYLPTVFRCPCSATAEENILEIQHPTDNGLQGDGGCSFDSHYEKKMEQWKWLKRSSLRKIRGKSESHLRARTVWWLGGRKSKKGTNFDDIYLFRKIKKTYS